MNDLSQMSGITEKQQLVACSHYELLLKANKASCKSALRFGNYHLARSYLFTSDSFHDKFMSGIVSGTIEGLLIMTP